MKASELRERKPEDLRAELQKLRRELFNLDFQWQSEENPDTSRKMKLKRDIARILTVLREMESSVADSKKNAG
jgi:large subunit ribosomal protein L29